MIFDERTGDHNCDGEQGPDRPDDFVDASQTRSDSEQTAADSDQTASDRNQTACESDAWSASMDVEAAEADQRGGDIDNDLAEAAHAARVQPTDEEQAAFEKSQGDRLRSTAARLRAQAARSALLASRRDNAIERHATGLRRDRAAETRDRHSEQRDKRRRQTRRSLSSTARLRRAVRLGPHRHRRVPHACRDRPTLRSQRSPPRRRGSRARHQRLYHLTGTGTWRSADLRTRLGTRIAIVAGRSALGCCADVTRRARTRRPDGPPCWGRVATRALVARGSKW